MKKAFSRIVKRLIFLQLADHGFSKIGPGCVVSRKAVVVGKNNICLGSNIFIHPFANLNTLQYGTGRIEIGSNSEIHPYAMLHTYGGWIEIGECCSINPFCMLYGHGGLKIGNKVRIATHTVIIPANHGIDRLDIPIMNQPELRDGISIGDDVWIGASVCVLDGVHIGQGSVVGAGSVVTQDVPEFSVVAGIPARIIRLRK